MKFLWVLCVLCGSSFFAGALNREAFTITKYDLEIRLEPEQQRLGARGKITLRNDSAEPQKIVALQISSSLDWRALRVNDKAVQFVSQPFTSDIDHTGALSEAIVTLPVAVNPKESIEIEVGYEGVIPQDATRLARVGVPPEIARHTSWDHIGPSFTAVRGAGYVAWYPITTESADFSEGNSLFEVVDRWKAREAQSQMNIELCADTFGSTRPQIVMKEGPQAKDQNEDDRHVCRKYGFDPVGTITPMFAVADYQTTSGVRFRLHMLPGHADGANTYLNALDPARKFVTDWFGQPSAPIAIADFADPNSAPFESGTLLMVSMAGEDTKLAGINLVHELVHSALPSNRPWVYEGLAHFAEAAYREAQGGRESALDLLGIHRATFLDAEKDVAAAQGKSAGQPLATTFDEIYYRSKAAYVWWMLRDMVGDDALKAAIGKYRTADDKDPKYVQGLVEAAAKRDLGWFFDDWVYHDRGLPDFRVQSAHAWKGENDAQMITITLENLGTAGAEIPFTVHCERGDVTQRLEVRAMSKATTRVQLLGAPHEIVVNDGSVPESDLTNNVFKVEEK